MGFFLCLIVPATAIILFGSKLIKNLGSLFLHSGQYMGVGIRKILWAIRSSEIGADNMPLTPFEIEEVNTAAP
jgi:hypothetical protein